MQDAEIHSGNHFLFFAFCHGWCTHNCDDHYPRTNAESRNNALIGLSVIIACILVPIVLIQNAYLFFKRKSEALEAKVEPLCQFYLVLNGCCLAYWLYIQFLA